MQKPQWRVTALAIATAVLLGFSASDANALALGRVLVQSALGEPLRADIEIPEITAEELASLRATIASPEAFRAAGFEYNPAMANIQITLQRRTDGRHYLRLSSSRPVNDPFVDLILEANWASGRMVRDYTLLFDPPNLRESAPPLPAAVAPTAPAGRTQPGAAPQGARTTPGQGLPATAKAGTDDAKKVTVQNGDTAGRIAAANKPTSVSLDQMLVALLHANPQAFVGGNVNRLKAGAVLDMPTSEEVELIPSGEARQNIVAQSRDFNEFRRRLAEGLPASTVGGSERSASGRVQAQVEEKKPAVASPDKLTLSKGAVQGKGAADKIARDRAAQDDATRVAELNKNISDLNKLGISAPAPLAAPSTGKPVLALPVGTAAAAKAASAPAALAVPTAAAASTAKAALPAAAASSAKPAIPTSAAAAITPPASAPAAAAVVALPASAPATATVIALPASAPATAAPAPTASAASPAASATEPDVSAIAGAAAPASAAVVAAAPAVSASKPRPAAPPPPSTSLVDDLLENPMVPASLGAVLALLLGFGFYRAQQRKKSTQVDSSFLESRLQPDSFFGASGGQRIDTNEGNATGSSMVYSPSQLDAAGDVDPVAEADVYLAYGRDLQAEEILKEAMRTTPHRVAVHCKLLEIYAKRRDVKAFELISSEAYNLTRGEGPEWDHICELGKELDPSNALYRPGGQPTEVRPIAAAPAASANAFRSQATQTMPLAPEPEKAADIDLDLDFSIGDDAPPPEPPRKASASIATLPLERPAVAEPMPSLDMDFGTASAALKPPAVPELPTASRTDPAQLDAPNVNVPGNSLSFTVTQSMKSQSPAAAAAPAAATGMIEFDLGALSLDLESPVAPAASAPSQTAAARLPAIEETVDSTAGAPLSTAGLDDDGGDPLATKLALAQEFNAIGDPDGARSLAEEVVAEASGELKKKAQRFLSEIA
jgi:pilus assembly protein FimV